MHEASHLPQEVHLSGSTLMPPFILMACLGQDLAQMPHSVHSSARTRAFPALANMRSASSAFSAVTEICPPPNSLARP